MVALNASTPPATAAAHDAPEAALAAIARALDAAHLDAVTAGDPSLERELMELFLDQSSRLFGAIASATGARPRREAAHRLAGAALAVGARDVADAALLVEAALAEGGNAGPEDLLPLSQALSDARVAAAIRLAGEPLSRSVAPERLSRPGSGR